MVSPTQDFNFSIDIFYLILSKASATAQLTRHRTESGQTGGPGRQTAQRSAPDPQLGHDVQLVSRNRFRKYQNNLAPEQGLEPWTVRLKA